MPLPFDVLLYIAELSPAAFISIRSISREVAKYTSGHMEEYMEFFSRKIEISYRGEYFARRIQLPNGDLHGPYYQKHCDTEISGNFKKGIKCGIFEKTRPDYIVRKLSLGNIVEEERYAEGSKECVSRTVGGVLTFRCEWDNDMISLMQTVDYKKEWDNEGRLTHMSQYKNGKLHGKDISPEEISIYVGGKRNGQSLIVQNGVVTHSAMMVDGIKHGKLNTFGENGEVLCTLSAEWGIPDFTTAFPRGIPDSEDDSILRFENGHVKFLDNGSFASSFGGNETVYYANGKAVVTFNGEDNQSVSRFKHGLLHGECTVREYAGVTVRNYRKGKLHGVSKTTGNFNIYDKGKLIYSKTGAFVSRRAIGNSYYVIIKYAASGFTERYYDDNYVGCYHFNGEAIFERTWELC